MLKSDPSFIYTTVKICDSCYESVKSLIAQTETNAALLNLSKSGESTIRSSGKEPFSRKSSNAFKEADEAYNAQNDGEEVTDMMSVEVKVTKEGTKITPRAITPRSDGKENPPE